MNSFNSVDKIDITVISKPSYISSECPNCKEEILINYKDFTDMMTHYYCGDWVGEIIKCPKCSKDVEIGNVIWD
jgi:phage FluMu protein Com